MGGWQKLCEVKGACGGVLRKWLRNTKRKTARDEQFESLCYLTLRLTIVGENAGKYIALM